MAAKDGYAVAVKGCIDIETTVLYSFAYFFIWLPRQPCCHKRTCFFCSKIHRVSVRRCGCSVELISRVKFSFFSSTTKKF